MFYYATKSNPKTTDWETSQVTDMSYMFHTTNQANPDVENWETSHVTNMDFMFAYTPNANPNTSAWSLESITNIDNIFNGSTGLSTHNYTIFLIMAESTISPEANENKAIGENSPIDTTYNFEAEASRQKLMDKGWTITDGGPSEK